MQAGQNLLPFAGSDRAAAKRLYASKELSQPLTSLELCAGGGGQALGLERAGFESKALVEIDGDACKTLKQNRPHWNVIQADITAFNAKPFQGVDLLAAGLPCPPFSLAGQKLGEADERNLFPAAFRIISEVRPRSVMIENVRGLLDKKFEYYRELISEKLSNLGYETRFELLNAAHFGVPQNRPRLFIVGLPAEVAHLYSPPQPSSHVTTVGDTLGELLASNGWKGARGWAAKASGVAPAIVGGSKKHGGPDLGPTRARAAWASLGVDGKGVANAPPGPDFKGMPRLTVPMVARIQGFPPEWTFYGKKTAAYRQVGNALPPPLAFAVAHAIKQALFESGHSVKSGSSNGNSQTRSSSSEVARALSGELGKGDGLQRASRGSRNLRVGAAGQRTACK